MKKSIKSKLIKIDRQTDKTAILILKFYVEIIENKVLKNMFNFNIFTYFASNIKIFSLLFPYLLGIIIP